MGSDAYEVKPFPPIRRAYIDVLRQGHRRHIIHGLIEVDVTVARRRVRQAGLSFTGFVVACVAKAVDEDRMLHAHRLGRGRLVLFEEVDRTTEPPRAEPERAANRKTVGEISAEIRSAARSPVSSVGMFGSSPGWGTPIPPAAARFAARLRELIESVDGLEEAPDIG